MIKKIIAITCILTAMQVQSESNWELINKVNTALDAIKTSKNRMEIQQLEEQAFSAIHLLEKNGALSAKSFTKQLNNEIDKANQRIQGEEVPPQKHRPLPELPVKSSPPPVPPAGPPASAHQRPPEPVRPAGAAAPETPSRKQELLEQIRAGKELRKTESPAPSTSQPEKTKVGSSDRGEHLKAIQAGIQLRKTESQEKKRYGHKLEDPLKEKIEAKKQRTEELEEHEKKRLEGMQGASEEEWKEEPL